MDRRFCLHSGSFRLRVDNSCHVKGAFTDASRDKPGLFEDADGGTLFLDEVGELPMPLQAKLLRVLQDSEIRRVGDSASVKVDVRLVAATFATSPAKSRPAGFAKTCSIGSTFCRFRSRLYVIVPTTSPACPVLRRAPRGSPWPQGRADRGAIEALAHQPWPGNVRELENVIERALVLADGPSIDVDFLATMMTVRAGSSRPTNKSYPSRKPHDLSSRTSSAERSE